MRLTRTATFFRGEEDGEIEGDEKLWDDTVGVAASQLRVAITREAYGHYLNRIKEIRNLSDKSAFIYTFVFQPQNYSSIRSVMGFGSKNTLDRSLRDLRAGGYLRKDEGHF